MTELNLVKGEKVPLSKAGSGLDKITIGGGWDIGDNFDLDLSAYLIDANGKLGAMTNVVFFGAKKHSSGAVELDKDNLTGIGEGDDEKIFVDFSKIPADRTEVYFGINIYQASERKQNFGMVKNAFIRAFNPADNAVLAKYDLSEDYSTATGVLAAKIYRHEGGWKFQALGEKLNGTINDIAKKFQ